MGTVPPGMCRVGRNLARYISEEAVGLVVPGVIE